MIAGHRWTMGCVVATTLTCACVEPHRSPNAASRPESGIAAYSIDQIEPDVQVPAAATAAATAPSTSAQHELAGARDRFDAEMWSEAISAAQRALQIAPGLTDAHLLVARAALQQGNKALARRHVDAARETAPRDARVYALAGAMAWQDEDCKEVIRACKLALLCDDARAAGAPSAAATVLARAHLGLCLAKDGYTRAAKQALERYVELTASPTDEMNGQLEVRTGMVLLQDRVFMTLSDLYEKSGEPNRAIEIIQHASDAKPDDSALAGRLARALARAGRPEEALAAARRAAQKASADNGIAVLEDVCRLIGKPEQSERELAGWAAESGRPELAARLAARMNERGKPDLAIEILSGAARARPGDSDLQYVLADAYGRAGRHDDFWKTLESALQAAPETFVRARQAVASAAATPEGRAALQKAYGSAGEAPKNAADAYLRAQLLILGGDAGAAETLLMRFVPAASQPAATMEVSAGPASVALAHLLLARHAWDQAISICRDAQKAGFSHVEVLLALAQGLEAQDEFEAAESAYGDAIRIAPQDPTPRLRLAELQLRRGDAKRAQGTYVSLLEDADPRNVAAHEALFRSLLLAQQIDRAAAALRELRRLAGDDPAVARCEARLKAVTDTGSPDQRWEQYRQTLRRLHERGPEQIQTLLDLAEAEAGASDFARALEALKGVLRIDPEHVKAREQHAAVLAAMLRQDEAQRELQAMVRERPKCVAWRRLLITLAIDRVDDKTTISELESLISQPGVSAETKLEYQSQLLDVLDGADRQDEEVALARGLYESEPSRRAYRSVYYTVLERAKRHDVAIELAEKSLRSDPTRYELRLEFVTRLVRGGQGTRAMQSVLLWLEDEPEDLRLSSLLLDVMREAGEYEQLLMYVRALGGGEGISPYDLLTAYLRTGRNDEAMDLVRALFRAQRPDDEGTLDSTLLNVAQQAKRLDEAERLLNEALEPIQSARRDNQPYNPARLVSLMQTLAVVYQRTQRPERGEAVLRDALAVAPHDAGLNNDLGYTWADAGKNLDRAEKMIRLAVARSPREAAYLDSLGWVEYKRGRFEEAAEWLRRAVRWRKSDPTLLDHAGDTAFQLGKIEDAKESWRRAVEVVKDSKRGNRDADDLATARRAAEKLDAIEHGKMPDVASVVRGRSGSSSPAEEDGG